MLSIRSTARGCTLLMLVLLAGTLPDSTRAQEEPRALTAQNGNGEVQLSWSPPPLDSDESVEGYNIYRDTAPLESNPGDEPLIATVDTPDTDPATIYQDGDVKNDTTYHYRVTALISESGNTTSRESPFSNAVEATPSTPPEIAVTTPPIPASDAVAAGTEAVVQATITDVLPLEGATLHFRRAGTLSYLTAPMVLNGDAFSASIPPDQLTARGVDFFVTAIDSSGIVGRMPPSGTYALRVAVENQTTTQTGGGAASTFRMISFPLSIEHPRLTNVLEDDLGSYDDTQWRLFTVGEATPSGQQQYVELRDTGARNVQPGAGFWFISRNDVTIDTERSVSIRTDQPFSIPLQPGWNVIGNPFAFPLPLRNVRTADGSPLDVLTYTGAFRPLENTDVLQPFAAYLLRRADGNSGTLTFYPDLSSPPPANAHPKTAKTETAWQIEISARAGTARDGYNAAALAGPARPGWDVLDRFEPPPIGEYVSLYFPHQDWGAHRGPYRRDVRPAGSPPHEWILVVQTSVPDVVQLRFDGLEHVPASYAVRLVDDTLGVTQNLRQRSSYRFAAPPPEASKRLRLVVGPAEEMHPLVEETVSTPDQVVLLPNYPNPVTAHTTIRYGLPRPLPVTLTLFNVLGRRVATLHSAVQEPAGYHAFVWNGRANGHPLASGPYFYRLRAGRTVRTGRLVLVR